MNLVEVPASTAILELSLLVFILLVIVLVRVFTYITYNKTKRVKYNNCSNHVNTKYNSKKIVNDDNVMIIVVQPSYVDLPHLSAGQCESL
eukprot:Awhi_evm1s13829